MFHLNIRENLKDFIKLKTIEKSYLVKCSIILENKKIGKR